MKIKILFFLPQLVGGGAERVTINIIKLLDRNAFDIHLGVTSRNGPSLKYLPNDITLHDFNVNKTIFSIYKIRKLVNKIEPDIFYSSLIRGHIAINIALKGLKRQPYLILRSPNSPRLLIKNNQISSFRKYLLENSYKKADLVIAQTPEMKDEIIEFHRISRNKIYVLLNPLNTKDIDDKLKNVKTPFNNQFINIVAAGRLVKQKGFDILIKSFYKVVEENSLFRLYIIGDDTNGKKSALKNLVSSLGLEKHVYFLGYKSNPYKYFKYSDLYVLSSRWEGLPNTVLENLYLKTPVVSTKCIPFMSEIIKEGENGSLVEVENIDELYRAIINYKKIKLIFADNIDHVIRVNDFFKTRIKSLF